MREIKAIPTSYKGIEMRSRMEAQCALLFDRAGWEFEYESKSYMLPESGAAYRPDFYLPATRTIVEVRGYNSERGNEQIWEFAAMVEAGEVDDVRRYAIIKNCDTALRKAPPRGDSYEGLLLAYCVRCERWVFLGLGEGECHVCRAHACSIYVALAVSVHAGKILLNGNQASAWTGVVPEFRGRD